MRCKKGFIAYYKSNGITSMKKYVDFNHYALLKKLFKRCKHGPRSTSSWYVLFSFSSTTSKLKKSG
jgi:hypothetical protein